MPYLLDFISKINHESALNTLAKVQKKIRVSTPIHGIQQSIINSSGSTTMGLSPGDAINFIGISGSGKSYIMNQIATYTINHTSSHVIYIDLDNRLTSTLIGDARFHLFKPLNIEEIIFSLEDWLEEHADIHVLWIMLDGIHIKQKYIELLRKLQKSWSFVLLTSTTAATKDFKDTSNLWDYRFTLLSNNQMQLIWPMHMNAFTASIV
ncbi:unnamed protein product [Mucor hiemalis]